VDESIIEAEAREPLPLYLTDCDPGDETDACSDDGQAEPAERAA